MLYIITFVFILFCALCFDFAQLGNNRLKSVCYGLLLIWLILISGLGYNVGADTAGYMRQYAEICSHRFETLSDLSYFENRQPGWMILNIMFSRISPHFVYMKLFIAVFANYTIISFIKNHTKYPFLGILLYFICFYLNFNFNSIRQTIAISFFLLGYDSLVYKKWIKYLTCCFFAFMFHSSAIICFLFPLFYLVKINPKRLFLFSFVLLSLSIFAITRGGADILSEFLLQNADKMTIFVDNSEDLIERYFGEDANEYGALNIMGLLSLVFNFTPVLLVYIGIYKKQVALPQIGTLLYLLFMFLFLLDYIVPVIFMRFLMYLDVLYICALSDYSIELPKRRVVASTFPFRSMISVFLICFALYRPVATFFRVNPLRDELPFYRQFYPYYSVFNPQIDYERASYYDFYIGAD